MKRTCTTCRDPKDRRKGVQLHFETICGMRVFRAFRGRKVYDARCPTCGYGFSIDGGKDKGA